MAAIAVKVPGKPSVMMSVSSTLVSAHSPRKILFLVSSMGSGGAERVASTLISAWAARGDHATLCVTFSGRGDCFYKLPEAICIEYLADRISGNPRGLFGKVKRLFALRRLMQDLHPGIIVSFLTDVNIAAIVASTGLGSLVIVSERSYPPLRSLGLVLTRLRRLTYPYADHVVMLTAKGLQWLESRIPGCKGIVIPNPVIMPLPEIDSLRLPVIVLPKGGKLLLAVGRLDPGKQLDILLESFACLSPNYPEWRLAIIGEGPERDALDRQRVALHLEEAVVLVGKVGNIGDWYSRADLYVMTSRYEGFPNTLAEAMAHGCPAVSYDCLTGPADIIRHEMDGLLVSPVGNVSALTHALDRLMADDAEREEMSRRAVDVVERYSLERILGLWDQLFDSVTASTMPKK